MAKWSMFLGLGIWVAFVAVDAIAGPCDAHYNFNGNLADSLGGYNGRMIIEGGGAAEPQFVPGQDGQALKLDGSAAMRAMLDLNPDLCPQMTIVAWLEIEPNPNQMIVGNNGANRLFTSSNTLFVRTAGRDLAAKDAILPNAGWMFVAAVWDNERRVHRLHWRARHLEKTFDREPKTGDPAIWIGASNDKLHYPAKDIVIDDIRFIGRALSVEEVDQLRLAGPGSGGAVAASASSENSRSAADIDSAPIGRNISGGISGGISGDKVPSDSPLASTASGGGASACAAPEDCPADTYCAMDGTCQPRSHLPMDSASGTTLEQMQQQAAARQAGSIGSIDYQSPEDILEEARAADAVRPATGGASGGDARQPAADEPSAAAASPSGEGGFLAADCESGEPGTTQGLGGKMALDYLSDMPVDRPETGAVRECKSFAERLPGLALKLRDTVVDIAVAQGCGILGRPLAMIESARCVVDPELYQSAEFQLRVLREIYYTCVATTRSAGQLPEQMLGFWNEQVANNGWGTIGPRRLDFGVEEQGNLISPGDRKFISSTPWGDGSYVDAGEASGDEALLTIEESAGKAKVNVTVCSVSPVTNEYRILQQFEINENQDERDNEQQFIRYDLNPPFGFLSVYLDARSAPNRHFRYRIRITE